MLYKCQDLKLTDLSAKKHKVYGNKKISGWIFLMMSEQTDQLKVLSQ